MAKYELYLNMEGERLKYSKIESLGIFAGGIAQDLNNLLTGNLVIISSTSLEHSIGTDNYENLVEVERVCLQARGLT